MKRYKILMPGLLAGLLALAACAGRASGNGNATSGEGVDSTGIEATDEGVTFSADSAYSYVERQVRFGPRIPGSESHRATGDWLTEELRRHGAQVTEQRGKVKAFDGTMLPMRNIFGQFNPEASDRTLLLAHYDTRPWADKDPDPAKRKEPIDGANDGASGVGVLLEIARQLGKEPGGEGIDILFVDCEDYGTDGDDSSWALGAEWFAKHPIKPGYRPSRAILLDMVGGKDGVFPAEYFSRQAAPDLDDALRAAAQRVGEGSRFPRIYGGAVTDDHIKLIEEGIPAIDIIDYRAEEGFNPTWHTSEDRMDNIDRETLGAVGKSVMEMLKRL